MRSFIIYTYRNMGRMTEVRMGKTSGIHG